MSNISVKKDSSETQREGEAAGPLRVMRRLLAWDPFQQMMPFASEGEPVLSFTPAFEVKETKDSYEFRADVPGIAEADVNVTVIGHRLSISGERTEETEDHGDRYFATERLYGSFTRTFTLPESVATDDVSATLANGVLRVVVPKKPEPQPKKIAVTAKSQATPKKAAEPSVSETPRSEEPHSGTPSQQK